MTDRAWPPKFVSKHFELLEFEQPAGYGCTAAPYPEALISSCLIPLCRDVLEVIRAEVQQPVIVRCGYRSPEYNEAKRLFELRETGRTGVAEFSQHMRGRAADIEVSGMSGRELFDVVMRLHQAGKLPELGGLGSYAAFIHVDIRPHEAGKLTVWKE